MTPLTPEVLVSFLALTGVVIVISALLSGVVQRTGLPQVVIFLTLGAIVGPAGLGMVDAGMDSPMLRVVATLSLVLVLFTDAVALDIGEVRRHRFLAFLILVPGTLASAMVIALAGWWLLDLPAALAIMLGAALASTDPVLLRDLLRRPALGDTVRQALRIEGGMNDAVLLPIVLIGIAVSHGITGSGEGAGLALRVLALSPLAGALVAWIAVVALAQVRARVGVRRDYEALYSLGIALAAFAAGEALHGSGFLAAFAAGLTVSVLDVELCDCFLEYGETTAEMALLFTFVLFGTSLIWTGLGALSGPSILFVAAVLLSRPLSFIPALAPVKLTARERALIAWFGPRGLSSLLLVLLPVFGGVEGAGVLVTLCCLVVLVSIVLHGSTSMMLGGNAAPAERTVAREPKPLEAASATLVTDPEYLSIDDVRDLQSRGVTVSIVDARSTRTYDESDRAIPGAARVSPDFAVAEAQRNRVPRDAVVPVLCA